MRSGWASIPEGKVDGVNTKSELLPAGANTVVRGRGLIVPLEPVGAEDVEAGMPRQGLVELGELSGASAGIWELRAGTVRDVEIDEMFVVISGAATIHLLDEDRSVEVKVGDVMRLTAGTRTRWVVPDHIRKVYLAAE